MALLDRVPDAACAVPAVDGAGLLVRSGFQLGNRREGLCADFVVTLEIRGRGPCRPVVSEVAGLSDSRANGSNSLGKRAYQPSRAAAIAELAWQTPKTRFQIRTLPGREVVGSENNRDATPSQRRASHRRAT